MYLNLDSMWIVLMCVLRRGGESECVRRKFSTQCVNARDLEKTLLHLIDVLNISTNASKEKHEFEFDTRIKCLAVMI